MRKIGCLVLILTAAVLLPFAFGQSPADSVLQAQLMLWDGILEKKSAENPLFKEIVASQKTFAERAVKWDQDTIISRRMAMNHFFGAKPAAPKKA